MLDLLETKLANGLLFEGNNQEGVERVDLLQQVRSSARDGQSAVNALAIKH